MDYDRYSDVFPILGTAAGVNMDGNTFTPAIDTSAYNWKSLTFLANISGAVQYGAVSWQLEDSDTDSNYQPVDASLVLFTLPKVTTTTSKVFTAGYIGKKRYVKAAFTSGGVETGQIFAMLYFTEWSGPESVCQGLIDDSYALRARGFPEAEYAKWSAQARAFLLRRILN